MSSSIVFSPLYMGYLLFSVNETNSPLTLFYSLVVLPILFYAVPIMLIKRSITTNGWAHQIVRSIDKSLLLYTILFVSNRLIIFATILNNSSSPKLYNFFLNPVWISMIVVQIYWVTKSQLLPDEEDYKLFKISSLFYLLFSLVALFILRFIFAISFIESDLFT